MRLLRLPFVWVRDLVKHQRGLLVLWWSLTAGQALVPAGHWLGRPDLVPWATLCVCLVAVLRARPLGEGPHPSLRIRRAGDGMLARIVSAAIPWTLLAWFESGRTQGLGLAGIGLVATGLVAWIRQRALAERRTSWNPEPRGDALLEALATILAIALAIGFGRWTRLWSDAPLLSGMGPAALVGLAFLVCGAASGQARNLRQRMRAGRRDGERYTPGLFRPVLAAFGPSVGLWALLLLLRGPTGSPDFDSAFVVTLHVVAWAGVLWAVPAPTAVGCMLHEVVPVGGKEGGKGKDFNLPPSGALRLQPLQVLRTRVSQPWLVPVQGDRIGDFDDPVRPLWSTPAPARAAHVLGDARFDLDPVTRRPQTDVITLRLRGLDDLAGMDSANLQARRIFVLHPSPPRRGRRVRATYRWEEDVGGGALQVVDATTRELELRTGSILVLSSEGVARAWEVEIGQPLQREELPAGFRPPLMEDYCSP